MAKCIDCVNKKCSRTGERREIWCDDWEGKDVEKSCTDCGRFINHDKWCMYQNSCFNYGKWQPKKTLIEFEPFKTTTAGTTEAAKHYQVSDMQPIEIMQSYMSKEQFIGFLRGNVIKHILRMGHKDDTIKEAEKACQYAEWLVKALRDEKIMPVGKK